MKRKVQIILGPPGTGKTTTLLSEVEKGLESGIPPERIAYVTFSKKASEEAIERACVKFNLNKDRFKYFRTLHSMAFLLLGLSSREVMCEENYSHISEALGLNININQIKRESTGEEIGDKCYRIYSLARARKVSTRQVWEEMDFDQLPYSYVKEVENAIIDYKDRYGLYEFADFIDQCQQSLDVDLFIIDEAQDLTKQQWDFARILARSADNIILAGDDDQAIFHWAGADVEEFLKIKAEIKILPKSYRLPEVIYNFAQNLVSRIKSRYPKTWESSGSDQGRVVWTNYLEKLDLNNGEWLLMARNKRQLLELKQVAEDKGVIYHFNGAWSSQRASIRSAVYYETLRNGKKISYRHANVMSKFIKNMPSIPNNKDIVWGDIGWPFEGKPDWREALDTIGVTDKSYIVNLRRNNEKLTGTGRIKISTIHGAKGGEADNVLLYVKPDLKTEESLRKNPDHEIRVWYVGITRAKKNLYLYGDETFFNKL